jgi:hypothetical protein
VSSCSTTVHNKTVGIVRIIGVTYDSGVVVMWTTRVTTLHPREMGKSRLPPSARGYVALIRGFIENGM